MKNSKMIKDMTPEELKKYHKERYQARQKDTLVLTIHNCPDDLKAALMAVIAQEAK